MEFAGKTAFLVGNGDSRRGFLLSRLRGKGLIVGCNTAYRDFPDFNAIVSIDHKPTKHIETEFKGLHIFNDSLKSAHIYLGSLSYPLCNLPVLRDKLDSGKLAAYMIKEFFRADRLIMLGMDFGGSDLYAGGTFSPKPNFADDWNDLLEGFKEVIKVGAPTQVCKDLRLKQITYKEFEGII